MTALTWNLLPLVPIGRLEVFRVVDLRRGVHGRLKVLHERPVVENLVVYRDLVCVVGVDDEAVKMRALVFEHLVEGGPGGKSEN